MLRTLLLVLLGFIPSLIWLFYYLRKDCHPEPKIMIAKTMAMGILVAPLAVIAQYLFSRLGNFYWPGFNPSASLTFFLWAALVEEGAKFLAVRFVVLRNPAFDEPVDAMEYKIG